MQLSGVCLKWCQNLMSFRRLENTVKKTAYLTFKLGNSKFQTDPNSERGNLRRKSNPITPR